MSSLTPFLAHIKWCKPDGTLTPEALRVFEVMRDRVGGMFGDMGADVFAPLVSPESIAEIVQQAIPAESAPCEMISQPAPADQVAEVVQQPFEYKPGTALALKDMRFALKDTAVTPGTYGDAASVMQVTVDQQGRLTFAQSVPIAISHTQVSGLGSMALQNTGTNFSGSFTGKTVTVSNGIITSVV